MTSQMPPDSSPALTSLMYNEEKPARSFSRAALNILPFLTESKRFSAILFRSEPEYSPAQISRLSVIPRPLLKSDAMFSVKSMRER